MLNYQRVSRIWGIYCTSLESCAEGSCASTLLSDVSGSAQLITGCLPQAEPGDLRPKSNRKKSVRILHKGYSLECSVQCQKQYTRCFVFAVGSKVRSTSEKPASSRHPHSIWISEKERQALTLACGSLKVSNTNVSNTT